MSSATLSSSPGPSSQPTINKRTHSESVEVEERSAKKTRIVPEDPNTKRDSKDKKKRPRKRKRKLSVVVVEDSRDHLKDSRRGLSESLVIASSPVKAGESSRHRSQSAVVMDDPSEDERDVEEIVSTPQVSIP